jgi:hypothetical protein
MEKQLGKPGKLSCSTGQTKAKLLKFLSETNRNFVSESALADNKKLYF